MRTRAAPIDQAAEQTRAERTLSLDAELNSGLGEFDELLLREQERVKAAMPRSDGGAGGAAGAGREGGDASGGPSGEGQRAEGQRAEGSAARQADAGGDTSGGVDQQGDGAMAGKPPSGAGGSGSTRGVGGQPADIPDGSDDDLVARQMREAAQKETDPELKKKLWEEYRKYKQGTR